MRICLLLLLLTLPVLACLNETEKDLNGNDVPVEAGPGSYELSSFHRDWKEELAGHEQKLKANPHDRGARNDRGVCLAHLGRSREALTLFQQLEREAPGVYGTAANMGTCYELCGQDEDALYWIRESIHRNPDAHQGTEWLHVKILEAKLALAQDPNWLQSHSVLGMDFGSKVRPHYPGELSTQVARDRVRKALRYQLRERMPLVPPPDPVVGDLLFDLANLAALMQSAHRGEEVMQDALRYGPPLKSLAKNAWPISGPLTRKKSRKSPSRNLLPRKAPRLPPNRAGGARPWRCWPSSACCWASAEFAARGRPRLSEIAMSQPEQTMGYDARDCNGFAEHWPEEHRNDFLYRLDVREVLSVDTTVWPSMFADLREP